MSSQIGDTCASSVKEAEAVILNESSRVRLGGLWPEDIAALRSQDNGYELVDYGLEDDGYHYWAVFTRGR